MPVLADNFLGRTVHISSVTSSRVHINQGIYLPASLSFQTHLSWLLKELFCFLFLPFITLNFSVYTDKLHKSLCAKAVLRLLIMVFIVSTLLRDPKTVVTLLTNASHFWNNVGPLSLSVPALMPWLGHLEVIQCLAGHVFQLLFARKILKTLLS